MVVITGIVSGQAPPSFSEDFYSIRLPQFGEPRQYNMIRCTDPDNAGAVSYQFTDLSTNGMFSINEITGVITRTQNISSANTFLIEIQCSDVENLNDTSVVAITIYMPNLSPPSFSMAIYEFSINEGQSASPVGMVNAVDPDGTDVTYELNGSDAAFFRNFGNQILSLTTFDRETRDSYTFSAIAYDNMADRNRSRSSTATVIVRIGDVNDNQSKLSAKWYSNSSVLF